MISQDKSWLIWVDVSITRRKRYQIVTCPEGVTRFRDRCIWPCIEWLHAEGITRYRLVPSEPLTGQQVPDLQIEVET